MSDTTQKQDNAERLRYWAAVVVNLSWVLVVILICRFFVLGADLELVGHGSTESESSTYDTWSTSPAQQATDRYAARAAMNRAVLIAIFMNFAYVIAVLCGAYFQNAVLLVFADILTELKAIREQQSPPDAQPPSSS